MFNHPSDDLGSGKRLDRRMFLAQSAAAAGWMWLMPGVGAQETATAARKPNIVHILADDLGYGDLGVQGCADIATPNIDSIAANGVRFTDGYVSCPVCSPTRCGAMTGRYQQRFGIEHNPGPDAESCPGFGIPRDQATLAERLKAGGYATGMVGKWHCGYEPGLRPWERGFDEFLGFLGGSRTYFDTSSHPAQILLRNGEPAGPFDYTTEKFTQEGVAFIEKHKDAPFYLYMSYNAVHGPLDARKERLEQFAHIEDKSRRAFAGMLTDLDAGVGQLLETLRKNGIEENTLIVFHSDNGGTPPKNTSKNGPLRGMKSDVWEGGIRVAFMMQWKGRIPAGQVYKNPVISLDTHPTALAAAGIAAPEAAKLDGVDLMPFLTGANPGVPHESLFWRYSPKRAVRKGDWKLVQVDMKMGQPELYNLAADLGETKNLAAEQPEKLAELEGAYAGWDANNLAEKWSRGEGKAGRKRPREKS